MPEMGTAPIHLCIQQASKAHQGKSMRRGVPIWLWLVPLDLIVPGGAVNMFREQSLKPAFLRKHP